MAGILNIAASGLQAFKYALAITSNNITNASDKSYTRQSLQFNPLPSQAYGTSFIGSGVYLANVKRDSDMFANQQLRQALTGKSQYYSFYQQAIQIDQMLSQKGISLSVGMQTFFDNLSHLNDAPDNLASRDLVMEQGQILVEQFSSLQLRLNQYQQNNIAEIQESVSQINEISSNIAKVNMQLSGAPNSPDLLDKRDALLNELSKYTQVTSVDLGNGQISVIIGTGETLILGPQSLKLVANTSPVGQYDSKIFLENGQGGLVDITSNLTSSGMLGGFLDFEQNILEYSSQLIGQMAIGLATSFNSQHQLGMDMNNQLGLNFFTDYNQANFQLARSAAASTNTGTGVLSVAISDINQTQLSNYQLVVTDAATNQITVTRQSDGEVRVLNWTNSPPAPPAGQFVLDGMTVTVDDVNNLANNDSYTLSPTSGAALSLELNITNPRQIALAFPVHTQTSLSNIGQGYIALGTIFNTSTVTKDYSIQFISPTQYNIVDVTDATTTGPFTFTPNTNNTVMIPDAANPSYSIILSGIPQTGDSFTASYNSGGVGDNGNGLILAGLQQNQIFSNGTESLFNKYTDLISQVAGVTYQAKINGEAAEIIYQQAVDFRDSKSAVDLDEEAANLLRFEQAYEAASKVMAISNNIMDALFAALR